MADGPYRFGQPVGQQFYYPQNQQAHPPRHLPRNGSPVKSGRPTFPTDTPSPSRSPGPQSPAHSIFGMYNQGHQQGQHAMMNGGPASRNFAMQLNMTHNFKNQQLHHHQQHAQHHHHHHQQQDHGNQMHGVIGHQHSFSSAGLTSATPHFTPSHLQNGTPGNAHGGITKLSDHWQVQLQLVQESRQAGSPHHYARLNAHVNKGVTAATSTGQRGEYEEERNRAMKDKAIRRQDWMSLDLGGQGIRSLSYALFSYTFLDKLYINHNKLTKLSPAIGRLKSLSHLDVSNNQLSEVPPEVGMLVNLKNLLLFDNNLHLLPHELGALYQLETLGIEGNPLDEELKSHIMQHGTKELITHLREAAPVTLPPAPRDWIVLDETISSSSGPPPDKFSVLTYNTLCDRYATTNQYGYAPALALSWDYRKELILQEVRAQNADIVCLQEVDTDSYNEYFRAQLAYNDYKGVFWPKSRAKTMAEKEAKVVDGCATLYKAHKYILLDKQVIEFANTAINRPDMKGEEDIYNRVMPRDNIAVITFFENRLTGSRLIVVNAHIFWDPQYTDVKLVQVAILMEQVSKLAERYAKWPPCTDKTLIKPLDNEANEEYAGGSAAMPPAPSMEYSTGSQIPLILCGDLNSQPGSGVYDLLAYGTLRNDHSDLADRAYGNFTRDGMAHPFSLKSSYASIGELSFTNYTPNFTAVIDYIWYSTNALQVTGLLGEVDKDYLQRVPGFPNYHFPSDHLALLAEFVVKPKKEKRTGLMEPDFGTTTTSSSSSAAARDRRDLK